MYGNDGSVRPARVILSRQRERAVARIMDELDMRRGFGPANSADLGQRLERIIALAGRLDGPDRKRVERIYAQIGFSSPSVPTLAGWVADLVDIYLAERD